MDKKLANESWEALLRAQVTLMREFARENVWQDLSLTEYDVLYTLSKSAEGLSLGELNRNVSLTQPALSRMVDRLTERGLVQRGPGKSDARSICLTLTPEGRSLQRQVGAAHGTSVAHRMQKLSPKEQNTLRELCIKLTDHQTYSRESETGNESSADIN